MKTLLVAIDAKYIHRNLAVRLLQANTSFPVEILESTIKEQEDTILEQILQKKPDVIGFSVYLWNRNLVSTLTRQIKASHPCLVVWGGPEATYDVDSALHESKADVVIRGEGEHVFHQLLECISEKKEYHHLPGVATLQDGHLVDHGVVTIQDLSTIRVIDLSKETDLEHRIAYIESSRGCPYRCSYCLASLEKDVRMFPDDQVFDMIDAYRSKGAKTFKFLDRTFNLTTKRMLQMMKALILRSDEHTTYQFEVTGDILTKEAIQDINAIAPKGLFRFEIGIQSIHEETNLAVKRRQNNARLFENIHDLIAGGIVTLHLDLIAGLPYETRTMFQETFDTVFQFHAEELQLGFLKLLHGTLMRSSAISMGYAFSKEPPYEFTSNPWLCEEDLEIIREVEEMLDLLWNKSLMKEILLDLTKDASPFQTLYQLKQHFNQQHFSFHRFQLVELFAMMDDYVMNTLHRPDLSRKLKEIYLMRHTQKPKIWWEKHRKDDYAFFRELHSKYPNIPIDDFYKYGVACRNEDFSFAVLFFPTGPFFIELP